LPTDGNTQLAQRCYKNLRIDLYRISGKM